MPQDTEQKVTITNALQKINFIVLEKAASLVSEEIFCHCGKWIQIEKVVILHVQIGNFCPFLRRNH